jgi:hypothetical protein
VSGNERNTVALKDKSHFKNKDNKDEDDDDDFNTYALQHLQQMTAKITAIDDTDDIVVSRVGTREWGNHRTARRKRPKRATARVAPLLQYSQIAETKDDCSGGISQSSRFIVAANDYMRDFVYDQNENMRSTGGSGCGSGADDSDDDDMDYDDDSNFVGVNSFSMQYGNKALFLRSGSKVKHASSDDSGSEKDNEADHGRIQNDDNCDSDSDRNDKSSCSRDVDDGVDQTSHDL